MAGPVAAVCAETASAASAKPNRPRGWAGSSSPGGAVCAIADGCRGTAALLEAAPAASANATGRKGGRAQARERQPCSIVRHAKVMPPLVLDRCGSRRTSRSRIGPSFLYSNLIFAISSSTVEGSTLAADINVVTLEDERVYRGQNTNEMELFGSLMILSRAYNESANKQYRLNSAWAEKRDRARKNLTPLTAACPAWLHLPKGSDRYELRPDRVAIVRMIFEETVRGIGSQALVKKLNDRRNGIRNIGSESPYWNRSYIERILKNEAVYGEYQPRRRPLA
jgi:Recombinase